LLWFGLVWINNLKDLSPLDGNIEVALINLQLNYESFHILRNTLQTFILDTQSESCGVLKLRLLVAKFGEYSIL